MRSLYKVSVMHSGPKSSHEAIEAYLVAESEEEVYAAIDGHNYGRWSDRANDPDHNEGEEYLDRDENPVQGGYKEWIIAWRGDFQAEESDYYYGVTQYRWEKVEGVLQSDIDRLLELGIATRTLG